MANHFILGSFEKTTVVAVSASPVDFTCNGPYTKFEVYTERAICIARNRDATTDDFLLPACDHAQVELLPGETLSMVLAPGETDGSVRLTEVS